MHPSFSSNIKNRLRYFAAKYPLPSVRELFGVEWSVFAKEVCPRNAMGQLWVRTRQWETHHIVALSRWDLSDPRQVLLCSNIANLKPLWSEMNGWRSDKTTPEDCRLLEKRLRRFGPYTADDGHVVRRTFSRRFTVLCFAFRWLDDAFLEAHEQHVRIVAARPLHYLCY